MRAVFLGYDTDILDALRESCEVVGVYVAATRWRGLRDWPLSHHGVRVRLREFLNAHPTRLRRWHRRLMRYHITDHARARGLALLPAPSVNDERFRRTLSELRPDIGVVANFGEILKQPLLNIPRHGFINFHPSLLPQYRGPTPLPHMLLRGESRGGVTWHRVSAAIDGGDILAQESFDISPHDIVGDLNRRVARVAAGMLPALMQAIERGTCRAVPQDERRASYYPKLSPEQKQQLKALEAERRVLQARTPN